MSAPRSKGGRRFGIPVASRLQLIDCLVDLRREWEEAVAPNSLSTIQAPVPLLLIDVMVAVNLTEEEREKVMGTALYREVETAVSSPL